MKKIVFPDTNIFLHYQSIDQIDLPDLLKCDEVELVMAPVVLDELDDKKWGHPFPKIRERAQQAARRINTWISVDEDIRPGLSMNLHFARPNDGTLKKWQLNPRSNDDLLFGTILEYIDSNPDHEVYLLTGDTGSRLRAESLRINVVILSDDYRLPPAKDEYQKEMQRIRNENLALKARFPSLSLLFADSSERLVITIGPQFSSLTKEMRDHFNEVNSDIRVQSAKYLSLDDEVTSASDPLSLDLRELDARLKATFSLENPSEDEIDRYRQEVNDYPQRYKTYLLQKLQIENEHRRTIRIDLGISNSGSALAEDMLLALAVPDHLAWCQEPSGHMPSRPPKPPKPPRSQSQILRGEMNDTEWLDGSFLFGSGFAQIPNTNQPEPKISNSGLVLEWEVGDCRQQRDLQLEPLFVRFSTADKITNFQIDYRIDEKNILKPVEGSLLIVVKKQGISDSD